MRDCTLHQLMILDFIKSNGTSTEKDLMSIDVAEPFRNDIKTTMNELTRNGFVTKTIVNSRKAYLLN